VVEHLASKCKILSLNPSTTKKEKIREGLTSQVKNLFKPHTCCPSYWGCWQENYGSQSGVGGWSGKQRKHYK
jgi:hypothetical protein